ncbi:MAG: class I SAM-dependent methyltransferase [Gemmatimonadales bacterium]
MPAHPASYRDPAGQVHIRDGRVLRTVRPAGLANYQAARASGFLAEAVAAGKLIAGEEVDRGLLADEAPDAKLVIEHPRLRFVSYPYEWSFPALRDAALLTLDLHLEALANGLSLSDASAYNIQFVGAKPVFIDYLSLIEYQPGQVWLGYRQFCEQFLNPLLLTAKTGVPFQPLYRGTMEGISSPDLRALLPLRARLDPRVALHVSLQARLQRRVSDRGTERAREIRLSQNGLKTNLASMRSWVAGLEPPGSQVTPWQDYERSASYSPEERERKHQFVGELVAAVSPLLVWDIGCNAGEYSEVALAHGAEMVIGFEPDAGAQNAAYRRARERSLSFLPLAVDVANPSPSMGWRERERDGLAGRGRPDLILALALIHHLILGRNLPMAEVVRWLASLAPHGVIEFVPKTDPMAARLLAMKPDIAPEYSLEGFEAALRRCADVIGREQVTATGRVLFAFGR